MWTKISDEFFRNPKIVKAGRDARDLYLVGLCHCNEHLTDGFIGASHLRRMEVDAEIDDAKTAAARLVEVGLWNIAEDGYQVHDFEKYNPLKSVVEAERAKASARKEAWKARQNGDGTPAERRSERQEERRENTCPVPVPVPVPVPIDTLRLEEESAERGMECDPPVPTGSASAAASPKNKPAATRGFRLPEGWEPSAADQYKMQAQFPGATPEWFADQTERFRDYWRGVSGSKGVKLDWGGTWLNWIRRGQDDLAKRPAATAYQPRETPTQEARRKSLERIDRNYEEQMRKGDELFGTRRNEDPPDTALRVIKETAAA